MRRRRGRARRVLAEVPARQESAGRPRALGRGELEAYSRLASELAGATVVMATGPARAEVAIGLSTVAAAVGQRVALLEADLEAPSLAATLGLDPAPGLQEYLRGEVEAQASLQPLVLAGPASGRATEPLACIVAGGLGLDATSLLDSERFRGAVASLRASYDLLVVDGLALDAELLGLIALAEVADASIACGASGELPKRLPVPVTGLVLIA
jgi:Mrp family chromosome partitioning ATPase